MKKPHHYWFYDQLFLFNFRLVWPVNKESLEKYVKDEFDEIWVLRDDGFGGKVLEIQNKKGGDTFLVALRRWSGNSDDHSVLTHECVHAALMILERRGVEATTANDESIAYLTAYLLRKCLNVLLPKRLRVRVDPGVRVKQK